MAKKKTEAVKLVEVRAPLEWYAKVATEAARLGLPVSTFIRVAVNDWLDRRARENASVGLPTLLMREEQDAQVQILESEEGLDGKESPLVLCDPIEKQNASNSKSEETAETRSSKKTTRRTTKPAEGQ